MVHLYALADHPAQLPAVAGIGASPLVSSAVGPVAAVFGEVGGESTEPTEAAILANAHVVDELAKANDAVLPARFARPYEDEAVLLTSIRERAAQLRDSLDRVRGCVEMGVRVVRNENGGAIATPSGSGSDYMRSRLDGIRLADRVADQLDAAVSGLTNDAVRGVTGTRELVLTAAYLLPRDEAQRFRTAV